MTLNLSHLLKLRAAVGRFGEMDGAGWWNTQGVLGPRGKSLYRRGLPRTHFFARVRVVTQVARARSETVYPAPGIATLWHLPPTHERALAFEERTWAANASNGPSEPNGVDWSIFESRLAAAPRDGDLRRWLLELELIRPEVASQIDRLPLAPGGAAVEVPGPLESPKIELLAAAHALSAPRALIVPFVAEALELAGASSPEPEVEARDG